MDERRKFLEIYLNDHLAGATGGVELVRRSRSSNEGTPLGEFLERLEEELVEDRSTLVGIVGDLELDAKRYKQAVAWTGEKLGRLKPNARMIESSPLSRVVELEALLAGVHGKLGLWRALSVVAEAEPVLARVGLPSLIRRAERQREELEHFRIGAVEGTFSRA